MGLNSSISQNKPLLDGFLHDTHREDSDLLRRALLQIRFGVLGGILALLYSGFYFILGHYPGGVITGLCGVIFTQVPWLVKTKGNLSLTGHIYGATLLLGITSLCIIDGGLESSSFAWLAAIPVCVLLVMRIREAIWWCLVASVIATALVLFQLNDISFPELLPVTHSSSVEAAASLGLLFFMTFLVLLLEKGRLEAAAATHAATAKLEIVNQQLVDLNRQKNEFLNIAAHDLKNPLSIICGYADLLREIESPTLKEIHNQASEILRSGNHMLDIIRNILDVRAIEDGRMKLSRERCCLRDIAGELFTSYASSAESKEIAFTNEIPAEIPDAWSDSGATRQILDNLISNAIKYTPTGGSISIGVEEKNNEVSFHVSDTGPGLSEKDQEKLWGKFSRLTPKPTGGETSNGLGLWIVRRLSRDMEGDTFCRSRVGEGSTFGVLLPRWTDTSRVIKPDCTGLFENGDTVPAFERFLTEIEESSPRTSPNSEDVALPS